MLLGFRQGALPIPHGSFLLWIVFTDGAQPWDHMQPDRKKFPQGLAT